MGLLLCLKHFLRERCDALFAFLRSARVAARGATGAASLECRLNERGPAGVQGVTLATERERGWRSVGELGTDGHRDEVVMAQGLVIRVNLHGG